LPSGEGAKGRSRRFLDRLRRLSGSLALHKPLSCFVILVVLLSSLSFLAAFARDDAHSGQGGELPARITTVTVTSFTISPNKAYVGSIITFFANVSSSVVGCSLNFTIYYDYILLNGSVNPNSPVTVNTTGNPGSIVTTHIYNAPGNLTGSTYRVRLTVNDGMGGAATATRVVTIDINEAPYLGPGLGDTLEAEIGVPFDMSVTCWDDDNDNLTLEWDFGDGSDLVEQWTGPAAIGVVCSQTHTWNPDPALWYGIGDTYLAYYVNLSLTDGFNHWENTTTEIRIPLDHNFSPAGGITINATMVDPADKVWLFGTASDPEGEPLTWTFVFNNSEEDFLVQVYHTGLTEPGTTVYQNTSYVFSETGNYTVTLYLSDLADPEMQVDPDYCSHNVSVDKVYISSVKNSIPSVLSSIKVSDYYTGLQDVCVSDTTGIAIAKFSIQTNDRDGEVLYATWNFGDGSEPRYNQSLGGTRVYTFNQTHEYSVPGQYNISVVITDGRDGHEVLRYKLVNITSNNAAPEVRDFDIILSNSSYGLPGSVVQFILLLYDLECNPLEVVWDFGDGSPLEWTNVSLFAENRTTVCRINHTYAAIGNYEVTINFTDGIYGIRGYHQETWTAYLKIDISDPVVVRVWNWWDYTSLALVILSIPLLIAWAVMGSVRRSRLDMMGVTVEEYMLRKKEIEEYDKRHEGGEGLG